MRGGQCNTQRVTSRSKLRHNDLLLLLSHQPLIPLL